MLRRLLRYFFRGLLIVAPATLTTYLLVVAALWLNTVFDVGVPGVGILSVAVFLTILGWIGSSLLVRPLLQQSERLVYRIPLIGLLYTSTRDLFDALVGDNLKFNRPVLVKLSEDSEGYKIGFVTQDTLTYLNLPDMAAVYIPSAYEFSGEVVLLPRRLITYLNLPSAELMKFVVSGGVSRLGG